MSPTASRTLQRLGISYDAWSSASALLKAIGRGEAPAGFALFNWQSPRPHAASRFLNRAELAVALNESNQTLGNPLPAATLDAIRTDGLMVITGQQPGLLTGPMYSVLKAITAVQMARTLGEQLGLPVLPAFWIAGEDHDIEEMNHAQIGSQVFKCQHEQLEGGARPPVARLSLQPWRDELLEFVERGLPAGEPRDELLVQLRQANYESYTTFFASLMTWLFGEGRLIYIDPMRMRRRMAGPLAALAEQAEAVEKAFAAGTDAMREAGYDPQLEKINCFTFDDAGHRVHADLSPDLAEQIVARPEAFSPGAALRPVIQDAMLPTLCTIGGPGEMQYLWQIDPIYKAINVKRSALWPRLSATLVDGSTAECAARFGLSGANLLTAGERLKNFDPADFAQPDPQLDAIAAAREALVQQISELEDTGQDKLIGKATDSINHQVDRLLDRLHNQRLSKQGIGKGELQRVATAVCPHGKPAERVISMLDWVGRFGCGLIDVLIAELDPQRLEHDIVTVGPAPGAVQGEAK